MRMDLDRHLAGDLHRLDAVLPMAGTGRGRRADGAGPDTNTGTGTGTEDPADRALAAIEAGYEDARARIIAGIPAQPDEPDEPEEPVGGSSGARPVPGPPLPTVPLTLRSGPKGTEPARDPAAVEDPDATGWWSRLLRGLAP